MTAPSSGRSMLAEVSREVTPMNLGELVGGDVVVGHDDELHGLLVLAVFERRRIEIDADHAVHAGVVGHLGGDGVVVAGFGDRHEIVVRDALVLLGNELGDRILDGEAADDQRRAAHDAGNGHEEAALIAEEVARRDLVQKRQAAPDEGDALEKDARAGARRLGAHERGGGAAHFGAAGEVGGAGDSGR